MVKWSDGQVVKWSDSELVISVLDAFVTLSQSKWTNGM